MKIIVSTQELKKLGLWEKYLDTCNIRNRFILGRNQEYCIEAEWILNEYEMANVGLTVTEISNLKETEAKNP